MSQLYLKNDLRYEVNFLGINRSKKSIESLQNGVGSRAQWDSKQRARINLAMNVIFSCG